MELTITALFGIMAPANTFIRRSLFIFTFGGSFMNYVAIFVGGILGGILRYIVSLLFQTNHPFPLATLLINLSGALLLGWFYGMAEFVNLKPWLSTGFATGFVGAYTTFSTFCIETEQLLSTHMEVGILYAILSMIAGPLLAYLGDYAAILLHRRSMQTAEEISI